MNVGVLVSGGGTNLQALIDQVHGRDGISIVGVGSDRADAPALDRARAAGLPVEAFPAWAFGGDRAARDEAMAAWLSSLDVELVVLAGYTQLVSAGFLAAFPSRVINIHPALLPAFPGMNALTQAIEYGVKVIGVTVHFVDEGVDTGPVIMQRAVELPDGFDATGALAIVRPVEYELLPEAVRLIAAGAVTFDRFNPRRTIVAR